jgi:hypothetical protein
MYQDFSFQGSLIKKDLLSSPESRSKYPVTFPLPSSRYVGIFYAEVDLARFGLADLTVAGQRRIFTGFA